MGLLQQLGSNLRAIDPPGALWTPNTASLCHSCVPASCRRSKELFPLVSRPIYIFCTLLSFHDKREEGGLPIQKIQAQAPNKG